MRVVIHDFEACRAACKSRDPRFDGWFFVGVTSTGIYCRPSCPAMTPKRENVIFYPTAASAQDAGFRACKRCRPDASPGSPEWDQRADLVGRAMRLIEDGVIDLEGVAGLAKRLHLSERHLHRQLVAELGAGPKSLARARRARTARMLIETTSLRLSEVAFASGFSSVRQFNDTIRDVFALTPTELRRKRSSKQHSSVPGIVLRLPYRPPFDAAALLGFLGQRAVDGIEHFDGTTYARTLKLPRGAGTVRLTPATDHVSCVIDLQDLRDLGPAVERCRRTLDLDADPHQIAQHLSRDARLAAVVERNTGLRIPGHVDGAELAIRAVLGQQVSVAAARTLASRLVAAYGKPMTDTSEPLTHLFPDPDVLADADLTDIGMPEARRKALRSLAVALADGTIELEAGADRLGTYDALLKLPGIGPWTASYIAMRALKDPDAFPASDLGVRKAMDALAYPTGTRERAEASAGWRPWRAYAVGYLWRSLGQDDRSTH